MLISHSYPPVLGGSEMEAQRVCAALVSRGHRGKVVCAGGAPMPPLKRWVDPEGVPVRLLGGEYTGRLRNYAYSVGVVWTLVCERHHYDVAYFLMQGLHLAVGLPVARLLGKAIVMKVSGSSIMSAMRKSWLGRLELRWLQRWAYRVMVLNPGMVEEALQAGFRREQLYWMPNPVDTEMFAPCAAAQRTTLRQKLGLAADAKTVVFVGRLAPEKELGSLISAFAHVAVTMREACLVLIGDGPERMQLEARATAIGVLDRVRFTGRQTPAEVRAWLQAGDVFALVSSLEGFSCSLVEAMAVGLPAVVSAIPANTQLIQEGVHGFLTPVRDERVIAEKLIRVLGDNGLRVRMGMAARQCVLRSYTLDCVADRYEELFLEAIRKGQLASAHPTK